MRQIDVAPREVPTDENARQRHPSFTQPGSSCDGQPPNVEGPHQGARAAAPFKAQAAVPAAKAQATVLVASSLPTADIVRPLRPRRLVLQERAVPALAEAPALPKAMPKRPGQGGETAQPQMVVIADEEVAHGRVLEPTRAVSVEDSAQSDEDSSEDSSTSTRTRLRRQETREQFLLRRIHESMQATREGLERDLDWLEHTPVLQEWLKQLADEYGLDRSDDIYTAL
eukprot:2466260-Amphidinium_carterae.2